MSFPTRAYFAEATSRLRQSSLWLRRLDEGWIENPGSGSPLSRGWQ